MDAVPVWLQVLGVAFPVGLASVAAVWWIVQRVIRVEVREVLDREFANGEDATADAYEPLRAKVDRTFELLATHQHDDEGRVLAPLVGGDG